MKFAKNSVFLASSLLERLKWPEKSGLARKQNVNSNPGPCVNVVFH